MMGKVVRGREAGGREEGQTWFHQWGGMGNWGLGRQTKRNKGKGFAGAGGLLLMIGSVMR